MSSPLNIAVEYTIVEILSGVGWQEMNLFLIDRQTRGLSPNTIICDRNELKPFLLFCEKQGIDRVKDITINDLRAFFLDLEKRCNQDGVKSVNRVARAFLNWWDEENEVADWKNPILKYKPPKVNEEPIPGVKLADIQKMIDTCGKDALGARDRVVLLALLDTGCRGDRILRAEGERPGYPVRRHLD